MPLDPRYARAIAAIESSGRYDALGPLMTTGRYAGDRAYGKYQVMGGNIPQWSQEALGRTLTPDQFKADPEAQDKVFEHRFGGFMNKFGGDPREAASMWFSGRPIAQAGNASDGQTTVPEYLKKFDAAMGAPSPAVTDFSAQSKQSPANVPQTPIVSEGEQSGGNWPAALMGIGASLQSIDNPRGAAVLGGLAQNVNPTKKNFTIQYDKNTGTFFKFGNDGSITRVRNPDWKPEEENPTPKVIENLTKQSEKHGAIAATGTEAADLIGSIDSGKLNLGAFNNWIASGRNMVGLSDENSREYAKFERFLRNLQANELRLNPGVQTEGDAQRAMQQFMAGAAKFDNKAATEALKEIISRSERVVQGGRTSLDVYKGIYSGNSLKPYEDQYGQFDETFKGLNKRLSDMDARRAAPAPASQPAAKPRFKVLSVD